MLTIFQLVVGGIEGLSVEGGFFGLTEFSVS